MVTFHRHSFSSEPKNGGSGWGPSEQHNRLGIGQWRALRGCRTSWPPHPRQANSRMTPTDLRKFYAQILKVSPITTGYYWMNTYIIIWKESSLGKELCPGLRVLPGKLALVGTVFTAQIQRVEPRRPEGTERHYGTRSQCLQRAPSSTVATCSQVARSCSQQKLPTELCQWGSQRNAQVCLWCPHSLLADYSDIGTLLNGTNNVLFTIYFVFPQIQVSVHYKVS